MSKEGTWTNINRDNPGRRKVRHNVLMCVQQYSQVEESPITMSSGSKRKNSWPDLTGGSKCKRGVSKQQRQQQSEEGRISLCCSLAKLQEVNDYNLQYQNVSLQYLVTNVKCQFTIISYKC